MGYIMKDYYELLELNKNASEDTIKKVFRMLIKKNHPDLFEGKEKEVAEEKVKMLNEAYATLIDKEKRKSYDIELEQHALDERQNLETLIQENEYLKNIINEKNHIIEEFLKENGQYDYEEYIPEEVPQKSVYNDNSKVNVKNSENGGYNQYKISEKIKDIMYMALIIFIGIVALMAITGINLFEIMIEIFKTMF